MSCARIKASMVYCKKKKQKRPEKFKTRVHTYILTLPKTEVEKKAKTMHCSLVVSWGVLAIKTSCRVVEEWEFDKVLLAETSHQVVEHRDFDKARSAVAAVAVVVVAAVVAAGLERHLGSRAEGQAVDYHLLGIFWC